MNPFLYAMFIFVKMQNCVKQQTDTCFPVQNTQEFGHFSGKVYKCWKCKMRNAKCKTKKWLNFLLSYTESVAAEIGL